MTTVPPMTRFSPDPALSARLRHISDAVRMKLRGKPEAVRVALVCLLARGHLLIEDVPGVGKTTLAQAIAGAVDGTFHRLQFTSDLLPSDVLGVTVFSSHTEQFEFKPGPVFANFLLADEINRSTPKTQSALLEAMNEAQVTVEGQTLPLPDPFMVIATQNPSDHHGTYPLPESQLDRFLVRLRIGYPDAASEREVIRQPEARHAQHLGPSVSREELLSLQEAVTQVTVEDSVVDYMLAIVERTRQNDAISLGVSPRGSQALYRAAQANALLEERGFVLPDDVKFLAPKVFGHRILPSTRGLSSRRNASDAAAGERLIEEILTQVDVPL